MIISGRAFLRNASAYAARLLVHQTGPPGEVLRPNSWSLHHPLWVHVRWSDDDNRALVDRFYRDWLPLYDAFALTVQRTDVARLMYLLSFGGIYADMDVEAHGPVGAVLMRAGADVKLMHSPVLLNEVSQNSLMVARRSGCALFARCLDSVRAVFAFINGGCNISWSCGFLPLFHNPWTRTLAHTFMTQHTTGPSIIDKTLVLHRMCGDVEYLDQRYYFGPLATHHQSNTWVRLGVALCPIGATVLLCAGALASCVWATSRRSSGRAYSYSALRSKVRL